VRYDGGAFHAEAGSTWIGPWTGYDWRQVARTDRGRAPMRALERDYWIRYPGVARPYAMLMVDLPRGLHAYARADNPGNSADVVRDNLSPPLGRTLTIGLRFSAATRD
jgi:hypothetical protein